MNRDIVYAVGTGSKFDNNELKYSLRSIEKHYSNVGNIVIVGFLPDFINKDKVIHLPIQDKWYKERNIMNKVLQASKNDDITEDFIHFNDDFYVNTDIDVLEHKTYIRPYNLFDYVYSAKRVKLRFRLYTEKIRQTYELLNNRGLPIQTYDIHCPMPINSSKFIESMEWVDWNCKRNLGYTYRSIYGNYHRIEAEEKEDILLSKIFSIENTKKIINKQPFFASGDVAHTYKLLHKILKEKYPYKSKYEL